MADTAQSKLRYVVESTLGVTPASAMTDLRFTGESLAFDISNIRSEEIISGRQVSDLVQVGAQSGGDINFELSYSTYDDFLEAALFGTWSSALSETNTDISAANSDSSFNSVGGTFPAFAKGQWIEVRGFTGDVSNNGYFQISETTAPTASKIVVQNATLVDDAVGESVTIKNDGTVSNGTTQKSFSIEKEFNDITRFHVLRGMTVGSLSLNLQADNILSGSVSFLGTSSAAGATTYGTGGPTAATTTQVMNAVSHVQQVMEGGTLLSASGIDLQSITLTLNNTLRGLTKVGNLGFFDIGAGRMTLEGTIGAYYEDGSLFDKYIAGTATSFSWITEDDAGNAYAFTVPNAKLISGYPQAGAIDQDVILDMTFEGIKDADLLTTIQIDRFSA